MALVGLFAAIGLACLIRAALEGEIKIWVVSLPGGGTRSRLTLVGLGAFSLLLATLFFFFPDGRPFAPEGSTPTATRSYSPAPVRTGKDQTFTAKFASPRRITIPPVICYAGIDLDQVTVHDGPGGDLNFGVDMCGPGLTRASAQYLGTGPATQPSPKDCSDMARAQATNDIAPKYLHPNETAFCVITDHDAVAWLLVVAGGDDDNLPQFDVMVWDPR